MYVCMYVCVCVCVFARACVCVCVERLHQTCLRRIPNIKWQSLRPDTIFLPHANISNNMMFFIYCQMR